MSSTLGDFCVTSPSVVSAGSAHTARQWWASGPPASAFFNAGGRSSYKDGGSPAFECSLYKDYQDGDVPKGDII